MASWVCGVTSNPTPTRKDHQRFVEIEGWRLLRHVGHHFTYEFDLPSGDALRTRVADPVDRMDCGPILWSHILRQQLCVTEEEFWACVSAGRKPDRGGRPAVTNSLPTELAWMLVTKVGLKESDVAAMSKAVAIERLNRFWTDGS